MIGTHVVTVTPLAGGAATDISCWVDDVSIRHGRSDSTAQPPASSATLNLGWNSGADPLPSVVQMGASVEVVTVLAGVTYRRFVGRIADIAYGWDEAGEDTPATLIGQIQAAGPLSDLGRRLVGDSPWPEELDGARVTRIMNAAGYSVAGSDPGTVFILFGVGGNDVTVRLALPAAHAVAEDSLGVLWETKDGAIRYADANHRHGLTPALTLDACDILVTPTWTQNTDGLVNLISVGYGSSTDTGITDQPRYRTSNAQSQAMFGRYEFDRATQLRDSAAAVTLANSMMTRNAYPAWVLSALPVDVESLTQAETAALLNLDIHSLVLCKNLPAAGSAPTSPALWLEGWNEHLAAGVHEIALAVSAYDRTAAPATWNDVPASWAWDTVPPSMTWNGIVPTELIGV